MLFTTGITRWCKILLLGLWWTGPVHGSTFVLHVALLHFALSLCAIQHCHGIHLCHPVCIALIVCWVNNESDPPPLFLVVAHRPSVHLEARSVVLKKTAVDDREWYDHHAF